MRTWFLELIKAEKPIRPLSYQGIENSSEIEIVFMANFEKLVINAHV